MRLVAHVNLDNAAFEDGGTDELIRAVTEALERLRGQWATADGASIGAAAIVRDINGNTVGKLEIKGGSR